jgi:hypothetical protein
MQKSKHRRKDDEKDQAKYSGTVIGTLFVYHTLKKVNTSSIDLANKCAMAAAVAYNRKKLLKWKAKKSQTAVIERVNDLKSVFQKLHSFS